jgi:ABC-type phosphate/phosphonate transport system substrate-binding protein
MDLVANARMYAVTPIVRAAWQTLFGWLKQISGVPLIYFDHAAPLPLEGLWAREDLGAVFMCGFPFALAAPQPQLIAAPVPSPARYGGLPRYCTDFVVRADHPAERLSDTFGGRVGWTIRHSQSGYNAVRRHLMRHQTNHRRPIFSQWVGPLVTPRRVIEAVIDETIDVGPLDCYVHDLLKRHEPETASQLRTIDSTAMTPIPPLIASHGVLKDIVERLGNTLISSSAHPALAPTLETLLLSRFASADSADYVSLVKQAQDADRAGVASPAAG